MWTLSFTDIGGDKTHCSSSTDAYDVKQVLKTFCIHAAAGPERATQSFQPHIIISVLQTFK